MDVSRKVICLVILLLVFGCSNTDNDDSCGLNTNAEFIKNSLTNAYKASCVDCLKDLLDNWNNEFNSNTNIPESEQAVYNVYKETYSPWALERMSNSEWGNGIYKDLSYYIIQDSISYDDNFRGTFSDNVITIKDFRPEINNNAISTLYLNKDYADAINCFLGANDFTPHSDEEKQARYKFLNNYLQFFHGHWGNYWHLETHPEIYRMSFNTAKDSVQVSFRLGYQGGEVILGKDNDEWKIKDWKMTWIE